MRVALVSRSSMYSIKGGDTIQVLKTAEQLNKLGIQADVFRACEKIPYEKYDLMHYFNIIRPSDHLYHIKKSKKPYVVSTIFVDYTHFDRNRKNHFHKITFGLMGQSRSEYLKNLYRFAKKQDELVSKEYLWGHQRAVQTVLKGAGMILPNSNSEYSRIVNKFEYSGNHQIIPNGVDLDLFGEIPKNIKRQEKVLCVAQIYGLKNQDALIRACQKLRVPLELVGTPPPNHTQYYNNCKAIGGSNVTFTNFMPQSNLIKHYASSKVHAMPSWFETTGLSSLEAGALGCNLVVGTGGDTCDYYKNDAWFSNPQQQESIEYALSEALNQPNSGILRDTILTEYTWTKAAKITLDSYRKVLNNNPEMSNAQERVSSESTARTKQNHNSEQDDLRIKILKSISYFDIFNHPLKQTELINLCVKNGETKELKYILEALVDEKICFSNGKCYSLVQDIASLIETRKSKEIEAQKYFKKLPRYTKLMKSFPFVRGIGISGSLSKNIMHEDGDIDYFIITAPGRLWICRSLLVMFKKIFLLNSRKYFCVNYFVDEENLRIEDENIFTAIEITHLLPVYNAPLLAKLKNENSWTKRFFPAFKPIIEIKAFDAKTEFIKKGIEHIFRGSFGDKLDLFFMKMFYRKWVKKFKHFNESKFELTMRTNRGISKHHPQDFQNKVLEEYKIRLTKLNISE